MSSLRECEPAPWTGELAATVDGGKLVAGWNPRYLRGIMAVLDGPVTLGLTPGKDGRVLLPTTITCPALPGWSGMQAMVDPAK